MTICRPGSPEGTGKARIERALRLGRSVGNDDAFAGREAIGFDNDGERLGGQVGLGIAGVGKARVGAGGNRKFAA